MLTMGVDVNQVQYDTLADFLLAEYTRDANRDRKALYHQINELVGGPQGRGKRRPLPLCVMLFLMVRASVVF